MSARVRAKDWSKTLLGGAGTWPPSLKLAVDIILSSGFPMCIRWGPELVMIYNDGYRHILGDRHPWALGLRFDEVWPEVQSQLRALHQAILTATSGAFFAEDLLINIKRRGPEWEEARFTVSYSPIPDHTTPSGVGGVLITAVETTNRVRTEEALRASEERFAGILRQTAVGVIQCELDGLFLLANRRFCEITGYTAEELLALRVPDITHPDDRETDSALRRRLVADGVPFIVEKRYVRPDGSQVWASVNVSLMRSADGKPQQFIGVAQDITDRKAAEGILRKREADLQLVLNSATDGVYCVDTDGVTTMCNTAFLRMLGKVRRRRHRPEAPRCHPSHLSRWIALSERGMSDLSNREGWGACACRI
jgi:PAS domain S-box-containing protein